VRGDKLTPHGPIACDLRRTEAGLRLDVTVPPGTVAELRLPWEDGFRTVPAGDHGFAEADR
jgi:hypothetical protein